MLARASRLAVARGASPLCGAARGLKKTTGIVGLEVEPQAKAILVDLYTKTIGGECAVP